MVSRRFGLFVGFQVCALVLTGCSLAGLDDGKMGTGGSTSTSSSTGTGKPAMFTWAVDVKATASPAGAIRLAPFGTGAVAAVSGAAQFNVNGTPCGSSGTTNICLATVSGMGSLADFADGIGGDAVKNVVAIATMTDEIVVVGGFLKGSVTFGSAMPPSMVTNATTLRESFVALYDGTTHFKGAARLRSDPAGPQQGFGLVRAVALSPTGEVYVTGSYHAGLWVTPPNGVEVQLPNLITTPMLTEGFVLKLDATLQPKWAMNLGAADLGEGHAIDANTARVVVAGIAHKTSTLGPLACTDQTPAGTAATSSIAFEGAIEPTMGTALSCNAFGTVGMDVLSVVGTPAGALLGGVYGGGAVLWPTLPSAAGDRPAFVAELDLSSAKPPIGQGIIGDTGGTQTLNGMAYVNGTLYMAGTSNSNTDWTLPKPGACFQAIANTDGFIGAEPKPLGMPFQVPAGGQIGSMNAETIDTLAVTPAGGIIVGGSYEAAFDVLPAPQSPHEYFIGLVNPKFLTSPACP